MQSALDIARHARRQSYSRAPRSTSTWPNIPRACELDTAMAAAQWAPSYATGPRMQAPPRVIGAGRAPTAPDGGLGNSVARRRSVARSGRAFTLIVSIPDQPTACSTRPATGTLTETRALLDHWARLQPVRSAAQGAGGIHAYCAVAKTNENIRTRSWPATVADEERDHARAEPVRLAAA